MFVLMLCYNTICYVNTYLRLILYWSLNKFYFYTKFFSLFMWLNWGIFNKYIRPSDCHDNPGCTSYLCVHSIIFTWTKSVSSINLWSWTYRWKYSTIKAHNWIKFPYDYEWNMSSCLCKWIINNLVSIDSIAGY